MNPFLRPDQTRPATAPSTSIPGMIPELCQRDNLLMLILSAQLLVLVLVLVDSGLTHFDWTLLALMSLFVQWIVLSSGASLCLLRNWLNRRPLWLSVLLSIGLVCALTGFYSVLAQWMLNPGQFDWRQLNTEKISTNLLLSLIFASALLRYLHLRAQRDFFAKAESKAQLQALQAHMQPHFLFNSLNTIAELIHSTPDTAETMLLDLADLLRALLREPSQQVSLNWELSLCRGYLRIEQQRLGNRLRIDWHQDPALTTELIQQIKLPPLCLQPLLENALLHGIANRPQGGTLSIELGTIELETIGSGWQQTSRGPNKLRIRISNPLAPAQQTRNPGSANSTNTNDDAGLKPHNRMALDNIRARLDKLYGPKAQLSTKHQGQLFISELLIPINLPTRSEPSTSKAPRKPPIGSQANQPSSEFKR